MLCGYQDLNTTIHQSSLTFYTLNQLMYELPFCEKRRCGLSYKQNRRSPPLKDIYNDAKLITHTCNVIIWHSIYLKTTQNISYNSPFQALVFFKLYKLDSEFHDRRFLSHCNTHFIFRIRQAIIPVSVDTGLNSHLISGSHHSRLYFGRNMWSVSK